jgi:hypothetical protein
MPTPLGALKAKADANMRDEKHKEDVLFFCDLIERELTEAVEDIKLLRNHEKQKVNAKNQCLMLRAAIENARHYLKELESGIESLSR